jgi:hypothetical protein
MSNQQRRLAVQRLLESKAVDFPAMGETTVALRFRIFDGVDGFHATMHYFPRVLHLPPDVPDTNKLENSGENLGNSAQVSVILMANHEPKIENRNREHERA